MYVSSGHVGDVHVGDRCAGFTGDEHAAVGYNGSGYVSNGHVGYVSDKYVGRL